MSTLKKLLALTLALAMVLSVSVFAGNYSNDTYADAAEIDEDCKEAIEVLYALDIMVGDGTNLKPNDPIKRAEMVKMIYVILNKGNDDKGANWKFYNMFSDVDTDDWYAGYVNFAGGTNLVQGYNGAFNPEDYLTTAQAAKMILTALGYSAEGRGYVGVNWEKAVLSDAAVLGLLEGYDAPVYGYAPRQWVAKMLYNSFEALTYETMAAIPGNGLLTSTGGLIVDTIGFADKYLGVDVATGYAVATKTAILDAAAKSTNGTKFYLGTNDKDEAVYLDLSNTGLGAADLGQQYKVVYKGTKALSVRNTGNSVVVDTKGEDISAKKLVYGTGVVSDEDAALGANHYEYTIGEQDFALESTIKVLSNEKAYQPKTIPTGVVNNGKATPVAAIDAIRTADAKTNNMARVIDKDADGQIDYVIKTDSTYAQVTKTSSYSYGNYVWLKAPNKSAIKYYIEDSITCDEDLVKNMFVKVTPNLDTNKYDVEVMPVEYEVVRTKLKNNVYTIGDVDYRIAEKGWKSVIPTKKSLDIVYDGDLIVWAGEHVTLISDLADLNGMLVVVTDTIDHWVEGNIGGYFAIEFMDINGDFHWALAQDQLKTAGDVDKTQADRKAKSEELVGNLWVLDVDDDGAVAFDDYTAIANLDEEIAKAVDPIESATLKVKDEYATFRKDNKTELMYVDMDATFFLFDEDETYFVGTVADLGLGTDTTSEFQGFTAKVGGWNTLVAGLIKAEPKTTTSADTGDGYLLTVSAPYDVVDDEDETIWYVDVLFPGDTTEYAIELSAHAGIVADELYAYEYEDDVYTLSTPDWTNQFENNKGNDKVAGFKAGGYEISNAAGVDGSSFTTLYKAGNRYDLWVADEDGADILVKTVTWSAYDEAGNRDKMTTSFEFVEELDATAVDNTYDGNTAYFSDFSAIYTFTAADGVSEYELVYVTIYQIEDYVSGGQDGTK